MGVVDFILRNILRLVIIAAITFAVLGFALQTCEGDVDKPPRRVDDMAYLVITDSRNYYTDNYSWQGDTLILHGFWVREGKKWKKYERDLRMPRESYGRVEVKVR